MMSNFLSSNPYVGPRPFQMGERIFGRDQEIQKLFYQLVSERIVLLYSQSGAGKTSLVQAGLIPRLKESGFQVLPIVRVSIEPGPDLLKQRPINRYLYSSCISIAEGLPEQARIPANELMQLSLDAFLHRLPDVTLPPLGRHNSSTVLIFDQFEQVFTKDPIDLDGKLMFFKELGEALRNPKRWALFVLREDFLGYLDSYKRLLPTGLQSVFHLQLLQAGTALQAIKFPALDQGIDFLDSAVQKLVDDLRRVRNFQPDGTVAEVLGHYVEPTQLQLVCHNLWNNLPADKTAIDDEDLAYLGDSTQVLVDYYADQVKSVAAQSGVKERTIRQWFDRRLIGPGGTRNIVPMTSADLSDKAIQLFQNTALVRAERRGGQLWLELTHDRLVDPILSNNKNWFEMNLSPLQRQAAIWNNEARGDSWLLRDRALIEAEQWAQVNPDELTNEELEFLHASRRVEMASSRERRQFRITRMLIAIQTVVIVVLTILLILVAQK